MLGRCDCVWCLCYHVYSVIIYTNSNVTLCVCVRNGCRILRLAKEYGHQTKHYWIMCLHTTSCDFWHRCCCFTRRKRSRKGKRRKWQEPMVGDNVRYFPLMPVPGTSARRDHALSKPSTAGAINWSFEWNKRCTEFWCRFLWGCLCTNYAGFTLNSGPYS